MKTIVGAETAEKFGFVDLIDDPASNAGCVVENKELRNAANIVKDIHKALADTFRRLAPEHLAVTVIAVRKGNCEVFTPYTVGILIEVSLPEVDLGASRLPNEFLCTFGLDILADLLHELLH